MSELYNSGYTHEALDRVHVLMETFDTFVVESPTSEKYGVVKAQAEAVHSQMWKLYQLIGQIMHDEEEAERP